MTGDTLDARDRCPRCGGAVDQESEEPLEEFCIEPGCGYYRAEGVNGQVIER